MSSALPATASAAPSFAGPTPPDRTQMGLGQALAVALNILRSRPLTGDEMMELRAFHEAEAQIIAQATGQGAPGEAQPGQEQADDSSMMPDEPQGGGGSSDYGTAPDTSPMNTGF